jgi:DNA invertase Pin-like site-specific DNA recombinase
MAKTEADAGYVSYFRVSTGRQGRSGLGLEAQRAAVTAYLSGIGGEVLREFVEVETGRSTARPELAGALEYCRMTGATLIIAKLDRLARNVAFIARLMESKVPFVAADMPNADRFMIHIYAAMAEEEGRRISERTRAALAAARARGTRLGVNGQVLAVRNQRAAEAFARAMKATILELKREGFTTVRALVSELNRRRINAANGGRWHQQTVHRLLRRIALS